MKMTRWAPLAPAALLSLSLSAGAQAQQAASEMTFFLTSVGPGNGADLGGLAGADSHCQQLAEAVGAGDRTWRAYLSTQAADGAAAVNARDRIGEGPWQNAEGVVIARDVDELHGGNNLNKETALTEGAKSWAVAAIPRTGTISSPARSRTVPRSRQRRIAPAATGR